MEAVPFQRFQGASLVTAALATVYAVTMVVQGLSRGVMEHQAKAAKKHFDRYTDHRMRPLDRMVGNTLEWMPVFLSFFWLSILLGADTVKLGWWYVAFRVLYCVLAYVGLGISATTGAKPAIFAATVPMYVVLWMLGSEVFSRARA